MARSSVRQPATGTIGAASLLLGGMAIAGCAPPRYAPRTRTYYVAAESVAWNYMPDAYDSVLGSPPPSPWGDSLVYPKLRYVGYSDSTFGSPTPQPPWAGILGPMIRGVVGDTIRVVVRNRTAQPLSLHPHGVGYAPRDEGALYRPPRGGGDSITPGGQYVYTWFAEPESGPATGEPSSRVWLYHSHALMSDREIQRGLVGVIVITDPSHAHEDAIPDDVDREFVTLWMVFDEHTASSPPRDHEMHLKHAINGRMFGNLHGLVARQGDRVRWYLVALGNEVDLHTPHWHGEQIRLEGRTHTDVVELLPGSMRVGDMVADNPGVWLLHCHVADHMTGGMFTTFAVVPATRP